MTTATRDLEESDIWKLEILSTKDTKKSFNRRNGGKGGRTELRPFDWPPKAACSDGPHLFQFFVIFVPFVVQNSVRLRFLRCSCETVPSVSSVSSRCRKMRINS
jgi:hypothetical protein